MTSNVSSRSLTPAQALSMEGGEKGQDEVARSPSATLNVQSRGGYFAWLRSIHFGRGIVRDIRARAPYYASDWTDAWNYRVIPAIVLIFFAK